MQKAAGTEKKEKVVQAIPNSQTSEEIYANKNISERIPPGNHFTGKISNVGKLNVNLLTENNLTSRQKLCINLLLTSSGKKN